MIPTERFINKLRELGYTFVCQQKRSNLWRKKGGTHFIPVPRNSNLEDAFVISALRQAGCQKSDIESFLRSARL